MLKLLAQPRKARFPRRRGGRRALFGFLAAWVAMSPQLRAQPADAAPLGPLERLTSPDTTPEDRAGASDQVLALPAENPAHVRAIAVLAGPPGDAARALLAAVARSVQPPSAWMMPCADIARQVDHPLARDAVLALGSFRTRAAAAVLVEIVADSRAPEIEDAAAASLTRLSGRDDILPQGWREWLAEALGLSDRQWEQQLLLAHIRRARALQATARDTDRRLAEAWRQIHLLTPQDQRSDVLVHLLASPTPALRDLGFDLVNREIGESRQLQPAVAQTAVGLLASPEPLVRMQAALLLDRLAAPEAETAIIAALGRETDPRSADALLRAASRWPSPAMIRPVLGWLDSTPALRLRAVETAWALVRAGVLQDPADREAVLAGARAIEDGALTAPACRILASLGGEPDLARLQGMLATGEPGARVIAADALALRADQVDTLLAAATSDAALFEPCAKALRAHLHDARGYAALSRLPSPSPQVRARALAEYAALLPTEEIIRLARLASDASEALHLLRPLTAAERASDPAAAPQLAEGLLLLSRSYLALGNPAEALNALSLLPEGAQPAEQPVLDDLRVTLLLWLNRIDQAEAIGGSATAWLDALEHAVAEPHAAAIAERLSGRFGELPPELAARLETLRQSLAEATGPVPPSEGG